MRGRRGAGPAALLGMVAACGGGPEAPTPAPSPPADDGFRTAVAALPVCDPSPWLESEVPRLTAPFEGGGSEAVLAAGITVLPRALNREEVFRIAVREMTPHVMVDLQVPVGRARYWILVDVDGSVAALELLETSGRSDIDGAGSRAALALRLTPAVRGDCRVPVWVSYPVTFQRGGGGR